jgi:hypothetical protein
LKVEVWLVSEPGCLCCFLQCSGGSAQDGYADAAGDTAPGAPGLESYSAIGGCSGYVVDGCEEQSCSGLPGHTSACRADVKRILGVRRTVAKSACASDAV